MRVNQPAGWVIERGGVALLMFVDPSGVLQWNSCFFVNLASQFHWFHCFSALAIKYGHFISRNVFYFWWAISLSPQWGHGFGTTKAVDFFFGTKVWSHLCRDFASQHQKISVFQGFPAPLPWWDIWPDGFVDLWLVFGTARRRWNSQACRNCPQCLCGSPPFLSTNCRPHFFTGC